MLDLNQIRADFSAHLGAHANRRHSLDAALMHVVERAYQKGLSDALSLPPVLADAPAHLDAGIPDLVRSQAPAAPDGRGAGGLPHASTSYRAGLQPDGCHGRHPASAQGCCGKGEG